MPIATTPKPPYYAVIFSSIRTHNEDPEYETMAERMVELAAQQPGFLGVESARSEVGITVSYWSDLDSIRAWKENVEHKEAQRLGLERWYSSYRTRIACVERDYGME